MPVLDLRLRVGKWKAEGPWFVHDTPKELVPRKGDPENKAPQIEFLFYKKPMANRISILKRSALSEGTKVASMTSKLLRRLKNTWEGASQQEYEETIIQFMDDLNGMGYQEKWCQEIIRKTLTGYMRILHQQSKGETLRNRPAACTALKRRYKRLCEASNWFKEHDDEDEVKVTLS